MQRYWGAGPIALALGGLLAPGAHAAVEYVRVCSAFPSEYLYRPGDATCINMATGRTAELTDGSPAFGRTAMARDADDVGNSLDWIDPELDDLREGVAATAALPHPFIQPGDRFAVSGDWGQYDGAHALGLGAAIRIDEMLSVSASVGVGLESGALSSGLSLTIGW
jgi:hypothetical protein